MKKIFLWLGVVMAVAACSGITSLAHAQDTPSTTLPTVTVTAQAPQSTTFVPLVPGGIPGLTDSVTTGSVIGNKGLATFFNNLYQFLIGAAVVLAIGMIIWGGAEIALNRGSVSQAISGKGKITNAVWGLLLVLAPAVVFTIINPQILNLNVNFPALNIHQGTYSTPPPPVINKDAAGNLVTNPVTCGADGCGAQISQCGVGSIGQCTPAGGGTTYSPGSSGCKSGDTFQCTTVDTGQLGAPGG